MKKIWRFLCSLRLGVWSGLGLAAMLLVSSLCLIFQPGLDDLGGPPLALWLAGRGNPVAVWWIFGLLIGAGIFGINLLCCTVDALWRIMPVLPQRWRALPPQVAHVGLLLLLLALLLGATGGFKLKGIELTPERWTDVPQTGFKLRLRAANMEISRNGQVTEYARPRLNEPVSYCGTNIYFSGDSLRIEGIKVRLTDTGTGVSRVVRLRLNDGYEVEPGVKVWFREIAPDFSIGPDSTVNLGGAEYRNPAAHVYLEDHGRLVEKKWFFVLLPEFSSIMYKQFHVQLDDAEWGACLRVDIARNPGATVALVGGLILLLGLAWNLLANNSNPL